LKFDHVISEGLNYRLSGISNMLLNLIFHKIVLRESDLDDKYTVTYIYFENIINEITKILNRGLCKFQDFRIYFDDGNDSFEKLILPKLTTLLKKRTTLAVVTNWIGKKGYLNSYLFKKYLKEDIKIASHGVSHSALAVYRNGILQNSLKRGRYQYSPFEQGDVLSEREILYQLIESKKKLLKVAINTDEFVLPHGLYNDTVMKLNFEFGVYKYLSTCDEYLDGGEPLRPRFLVDNEKTISKTIKQISNLSDIYDFKSLQNHG